MRLPVLVAFAVSFALQPFVIRVLVSRHILDTPSSRSSHVAPTPRGGGIAIVAGVLIGILLSGGWSEGVVRAVLVAASAFAILGLVEDVHGVPALARLLTQFVIAVLVVAAVSVPVGWMLMAMFFVVAYVNAFNFMDGVNGISGLNATMTGLVYAWLATDHGLTSLASASLVLAAASLGFLPWNMPRARVFLGDVGSYALGGIVAALALGLLVGGVDWVLVFAPLSLYLADTGTTLGRRVMAGEQILEPHRDHTYQRLTDRGLSHSAVAFATSTMAVLATIVAIVLDRATSSSIAALAGVGAIVGVYLWLPYSPGLRGGGHLAPKSVEPS